MKAVIMEIKDGYAAILKEDGTFAKIPRAGNVGDTIEVPDVIPFEKASGSEAPRKNGRQINHRKIARIIAIAAAVVLVTLGGGGYYFTTDAATSVVVDTGSSTVTLELNHFNRVIGFKADEEDTEGLLDSLQKADLRNHTLADALDKVDDVMRERGAAPKDAKPNVRIFTENERTYDMLREEVEPHGYPVSRIEDRREIPQYQRGGQDRVGDSSSDEQPAKPQGNQQPSGSNGEESRGEQAPEGQPAQPQGNQQPSGSDGGESRGEQAPEGQPAQLQGNQQPSGSDGEESRGEQAPEGQPAQPTGNQQPSGSNGEESRGEQAPEGQPAQPTDQQ